MRRSKSDPAKYARNYRKISQRRMTQYEDVDEEKEIQRLKGIIRTSEKYLKQVEEPIQKPENIKGKRKVEETILSKEFLIESGHTDENPLVVLPRKKKKKDKKAHIVILSPQEIREARAVQKKTVRKLQQLETRATKQKKRAELYKRLQEDQLTQAALQPLLLSSGKLSRKDSDTKKQTLKKIFYKERAGLSLTKDEERLLYPEKQVVNDPPPSSLSSSLQANEFSESPSVLDFSEKKISKEIEGRVKAKKILAKKDHINSVKDKLSNTEPHIENLSEYKNENGDATKNYSRTRTHSEDASQAVGIDFAANMMASLTKIKDKNNENQQATTNKGREMEETDFSQPKERYIPSKPTILKTAATMGLEASTESVLERAVLNINRPDEVEKTRVGLPVTAMEFEIMDSIRNNDVTIICGETGSGKSTQIPAYLYEGGMSLCPSDPTKSFLIGVTQPRRVAAVSTAKRVCFELGQGDGQSIKGSGAIGNLVAYKTRYESAGSGDSTRIQFMTDGILLSEIQSDLLLRKYSVIVLDESHERNLNTDVLIGLLSVALPLRKKAAQEDPSIVPLKLILMSATLRVEDFTKNEKLFPTGQPAVVTVPGRTHPVTVHHSKVTELDDYETVAFQKICKIHHKLPHGGILVFLTGKAEIIRMVNRLRKALSGSGKNKRFKGSDDVVMSKLQLDLIDTPREIDDEELDAEDENCDDYDNIDEEFEDNINILPKSDNESVPKHVHVLPLYSLLSTVEQAKVFSPVPANHRLIVLATNIAETSITIPGISYVIDTGRQKCRNYNSVTGVASYDIMWISKASANQRAGRAGRTGPGHCYRLFSSSLFSRYMDDFALPEVLTRPLEDIVLAMKAMNISNVLNFPFPTPPDNSQINAAVKLLANIGCVDISKVECDGGDGVATKLGKAISKLPLGVRYAKMLIVAAQAGILDYAIVVVAILSEANPFSNHDSTKDYAQDANIEGDEEDLDDIDKNLVAEKEKRKKVFKKWFHHGGDVLASMLAVGAYTYAGRGAGGASENFANSKFCEENGLDYAIMCRIQKMRSHLANIAKNRLGTQAVGVAARFGGFSHKMSPPSKIEEMLLIQSITSGLLDHVALLATPGSISGDHPIDLRSAYIGCSSSIKNLLFLDTTSLMHTRDYRQLPRWICYDSVVRKTTRDGTSINVMKNITPIDPTWLGKISKETRMIALGPPLPSPPPTYDIDQDAILCSVTTKYGSHGWEICPTKKSMYETLNCSSRKGNSGFLREDSFRWFARFLWEGKVISEFNGLPQLMNDSPSLITQRTPSTKVNMLVTSLARAGIDSAGALRKHWSEKDDKFLFLQLKKWIKRENHSQAKRIWIEGVSQNIKRWKDNCR